MPRHPDPNSKISQVILRAKPWQEDKVRWFKNWCLKNQKDMSDLLFERIDSLAKEHHYPFGHSQTEINEFSAYGSLAKDCCSVCGKPSKFKAFVDEKVTFLCKQHFDRDKHKFAGWKKL